MQARDREAYNRDKKLNSPPKKIFLDIYTGWCGWCKKMDATTFKNPVVVKAMNTYYYPVKLDAEMSDTITFNNHTFSNPNPKPIKGRRGTHQLAASLLDNQMSYPSYVIMDENTSRMTIYKGYKKEGDMLSILTFFGTNQYLNYKNFLETQFKQQLNKPIINN
jgi:thioredoxin-related protein